MISAKRRLPRHPQRQVHRRAFTRRWAARRMIEDMTVRNFVAKTQTDYIRRVKNFAIFLGRSG
jgi:hypothetical protein